MNYKDFEKQAKEIGVGNRCIVSIEGTEITDARLQKEDGDWYVCQNAKDGAYCADKLGYNHSWFVYGGTVHKVDYLKPYEVKLRSGVEVWYEFIRLYYKLLPLFTYFIQNKQHRLQVLQLLQGEVYNSVEVPVRKTKRDVSDKVEK